MRISSSVRVAFRFPNGFFGTVRPTPVVWSCRAKRERQVTESSGKACLFVCHYITSGAPLGAAPPLIIYAFLMDCHIAGLTDATKG
jgi:hypothetical protein